LNICTIIARNYAAHARVLAKSFAATHPDAKCSVLVIDEPEGHLDPANEPFELMRIDEIGLPDPERMAAVYDVVELSTAVKPWLLRHLLDRDDDGVVAYLDPDIRVESSLAEIDSRAREHGGVLTPHLTSPLPRDGRKPREEDIMIAGSYNLGFIALGADGEVAGPLLEWWSERLENECLIDPGNGLFVDQRWIDLAPGMWPQLSILRNPAYNVAYWNLPYRQLEIDGDGYLVDGEPLRFFHFSGYDPRRPNELSKHQNRIKLRDDPALSRICDEYGKELREAGFEQASTWSYGWSEAANGLKLDRIARGLFREAVDTGRLSDSVFAGPGAATFTEYLTATIHGSDAAAINRYATALWESRQDLRDVFPDIEGASAIAYLEWMRNFGDETGMSVDLLLGPAEPNGDGPGAETGGSGEEEESSGPRSGVNVVGYISSERGVGEAARQIISALEVRGIPAAPIDTPADPAEIKHVLTGIADSEHPYDFNLICVNADMLPAVAGALGQRFFIGHRTAGLWFWEISTFPEQWFTSFQHLDEVWVASEFIAEALRPVSPIPVQTMRVPVTPAEPEDLSRSELNMPEGFTFLFVFDYRSVFRRKNPLGLVEAFCQAFEPGEGPSLVIKSIFGEEFPAHSEQLRQAVADRPEIHLIEDNISAAAKNAMVASCDCYVSLHRSEGLGLTMAEAMYFGKPVIATAYSGNLDFMSAENSFLVPFEEVPIGEDANPYPPDGEWAEPDLEYAAETMRAVFRDRAAREERGRRGAADIRLTHSPEAASAWVEARLIEGRTESMVAHLLTPGPASSHSAVKGELDDLLRLGGLPPNDDPRQVRGQARRVYNRLLRRYAAYQHQINDSNARAFEELRGELADLRIQLAGTVATGAETHGRLAGVEERVRVLGAEDAHQAERLGRFDQRLSRSDELADAAAAQPYMADERLAPREHPLLGETMGFRTEGEGAHEGYRSFEDLFRGPEEMIRERQRVYLDLVADHQPVLDLGCGRGEFLDLLAERGIEFQGVDLDPDMVERCREKGYESVELGDAIEFLERAEPGSLGTIFSAQVIEHLPFEALQKLLELGLSRLEPGGLFIAETVNPHSAQALKAFWVDPTHQHPLFPEVMLSLSETAGYVSGDVFAPVGSGDWEADRTQAGEYAIVAVAPAALEPAKTEPEGESEVDPAGTA
jgi:glycosyltransferase involved in cell wall biosynthesis/SAM-dependent methyltransferase